MAGADLGPRQIFRVFFREFKLSVAPYVHSNDHIVLKTSSHFKIYRKQVLTWIRAKKKKRKQKKCKMDRYKTTLYDPMVNPSFYSSNTRF